MQQIRYLVIYLAFFKMSIMERESLKASFLNVSFSVFSDPYQVFSC